MKLGTANLTYTRCLKIERTLGSRNRVEGKKVTPGEVSSRH